MNYKPTYNLRSLNGVNVNDFQPPLNYQRSIVLKKDVNNVFQIIAENIIEKPCKIQKKARLIVPHQSTFRCM